MTIAQKLKSLFYKSSFPIINLSSIEQYQKMVKLNYADTSNHFSIFIKLIDELSLLPNVDIVPLCNLQKNDPSKIKIGIRFDIDADPFTALKCAKHLASLSLSGSFYFLHTAPYYNIHEENCIIRRPEIREFMTSISLAGSEIGLHIDPLGCFKFFNNNGFIEVSSEIDYIRSLGINIQGVVAHNSGPVYGAENSEMYAEILTNKRKIKINGKKISLGQYSLSQHNLEYEGTFSKIKESVIQSDIKKYFNLEASFQNPDFLEYFFTSKIFEREVDFQLWCIGKNKWVFSSKDNYEVCSLKKSIDLLKGVDKGSKVLIVLHPVYFSKN